MNEEALQKCFVFKVLFLTLPSLMFKSLIILCVSALFLTSCCTLPCHYNVVGPDEFVMDSYRIREGKGTILEMMGKPVGTMPADAMHEYRDEIADDDVLNIALFHPSRKDLRESFEYINQTVGGFVVTEGKVHLPDLPPTSVAGLTITEAQDRLREEIQKNYHDAELFVGYKLRRQRKVDLLGVVGTPTIAVDGKMRLYELVGKAGVRSDANLFTSYVMRDGEVLPIDLYKLIVMGDMSQNIVMKGGDKVFIAPQGEDKVVVLGEVGSPRAIDMPRGSMPLNEAIVIAGGIKTSADLCHLLVIRGSLQCPKIYDLTWEHVICLPSHSLLLMPGDTVFVSKKPISKWNEFMSDLLPTLNVVNSLKDAKNVLYLRDN